MEIKLLTTEEIAETLHCSRRYVYRLIGTDNFPKMKVGKKYLVPAEDLARWLHDSCGVDSKRKKA